MVGRELAGGVTAGLAPHSTVNAIALPLLTAVRERYPSILLHITQNFGGVLSEAMMTSRMDMALLYDAGPIKGVDFVRLLTEELMVVAPAGTGLPGAAGTAVSIKELVDLPLLLPGPMHTIRKVVEQAYEYAFEQARVVGEVESVTLMAQVVRNGLGASVLPLSVARRIMNVENLELRRIEPTIEVQVSLGTPSNQPLSKPAEAVREVLRTVVPDPAPISRSTTNRVLRLRPIRLPSFSASFRESPHPKLETPAMNAPPSPHDRHHVPSTPQAPAIGPDER